MRRACTVTAVGSNVQKVADLDARDDQAAALARRLTAWLAERGIMATGMISGIASGMSACRLLATASCSDFGTPTMRSSLWRSCP